VREIELVTLAELQEIRRIWVLEKHEVEDTLPRIYEEIVGEPYPGAPLDDNPIFRADEMQLLRQACEEVCDGDETAFALARELLDVERRYRSMARRAGLFDAIEASLRKHVFKNEEDARQFEHEKLDLLGPVRKDLEELQKIQKDTPSDKLPVVQLSLLDRQEKPARTSKRRTQTESR
jgi:DNA sulfur modification protein DndC